MLNLNEAQATEAIKEANVSHAVKVKEAVLCHITRIKEAEACHTTNSLCFAANPQGKYASTRVQSNNRRRMGLLHLSGGLFSSLMSLSAQNSWGNNVPLTTFNWQCATSCPVGNAGCHPATGCSWKRTNTSGFHPQWIRHASTSNGCKMVALFIQ